jgi:hypothetical protein
MSKQDSKLADKYFFQIQLTIVWEVNTSTEKVLH